MATKHLHIVYAKKLKQIKLANGDILVTVPVGAEIANVDGPDCLTRLCAQMASYRKLSRPLSVLISPTGATPAPWIMPNDPETKYQVGEKVWLKPTEEEPKWEHGKIISAKLEMSGDGVYVVQLDKKYVSQDLDDDGLREVEEAQITRTKEEN